MDVTKCLKGYFSTCFLCTVFGSLCFLDVVSFGNSFVISPVPDREVQTISQTDMQMNSQTYLDLMNILIKLDVLQEVENSTSSCLSLLSLVKTQYQTDETNGLSKTIEINLRFRETESSSTLSNLPDKNNRIVDEIRPTADKGVAVQLGNCVFHDQRTDLETLSLKEMKDNYTVHDGDEAQESNKSLAVVISDVEKDDNGKNGNTGNILLMLAFYRG